MRRGEDSWVPSGQVALKKILRIKMTLFDLLYASLHNYPFCQRRQVVEDRRGSVSVVIRSKQSNTFSMAIWKPC